MALRDWSFARLALLWAAWLALLFGGFLALLVGSPEGVEFRISPAEARGTVRWMLAAVGGLVLVLPPAIVTYLWYLARLRAWGSGESRRAASPRVRSNELPQPPEQPVSRVSSRDTSNIRRD